MCNETISQDMDRIYALAVFCLYSELTFGHIRLVYIFGECSINIYCKLCFYAFIFLTFQCTMLYLTSLIAHDYCIDKQIYNLPIYRIELRYD